MKVESLTPLDIQANRFDLLSRLADDLAHEIKNPIHAAVINLELLRRRIAGGEAEGALERAAVLGEQIARVHALVDGLLQLLRPPHESAARHEFDRVVGELRPLLEAVTALARVDLRVAPAGASGVVRVERTALKHAVLNLVVNALEAMHGEAGRLELATTLEGDEVRLRIRDSGPGISPELRGRIGTPGLSTRPGHAGLGLAVADQLLQPCGGRVALESPGGEGKGAVFVLALPLADHA